MLLQRTQVQFLAPPRPLTTVTPVPGGLALSSGIARHHADKTLIHQIQTWTVVQAAPAFAMLTNLTSSLRLSSCFCLLRTETTGTRHHTRRGLHYNTRTPTSWAETTGIRHHTRREFHCNTRTPTSRAETTGIRHHT